VKRATAVPLGTIALVGYTNAGKSTLFHALSRAEVLVSSRMFATLDPTIRALRLPSTAESWFPIPSGLSAICQKDC